MKQLPNIAFTAKMRAGKDTVFEILEELGYPVKRIAFGDVMKERFFETFPWIPKEPKPIEQLQAYGQAMRNIDEDVWVVPTMQQASYWSDYSEYFKEPITLVCTDVRQPNEFQAVKDAGFLTVRIDSTLKKRYERIVQLGEVVDPRVFRAETENHVDTFRVDYVIKNNGTREELKREVEKMVEELLKR